MVCVEAVNVSGIVEAVDCPSTNSAAAASARMKLQIAFPLKLGIARPSDRLLPLRPQWRLPERRVKSSQRRCNEHRRWSVCFGQISGAEFLYSCLLPAALICTRGMLLGLVVFASLEYRLRPGNRYRRIVFPWHLNRRPVSLQRHELLYAPTMLAEAPSALTRQSIQDVIGHTITPELSSAQPHYLHSDPRGCRVAGSPLVPVNA
mmetsp:Transcript_67805/g.196344  ORF Transcript_67805/g.196344 Transcript_67805/m.196344 type:complete len:205 (-) Transcript_67805:343-957(-)